MADQIEKEARLTKAQRAWLERWPNNRLGPGGEFSNPYIGGFEAVTWNRMAKRMSTAGIIEPYTFGGFKLTDTGRLALKGHPNG